MILRLAYILFLGILLALFVGVGIAAFYQAPQPPEYDETYSRPKPVAVQEATSSAEIERQEREQAKRWEVYSEKNERYNMHVSIIALIASLVILIISLTLANRLSILADGLLVGSVLTLLYSITRGFSAEEPIYRFVVVSVGLLVALLIGYLKFVRSQK